MRWRVQRQLLRVVSHDRRELSLITNHARFLERPRKRRPLGNFHLSMSTISETKD